MNIQNLIQKLEAKKASQNWREALQITEKLIKLLPRDPGAHSQMGLVLAQLGRLSEAIRYTEKALSLSPQHPGIRGDLGELYRRNGNYNKAIALLAPLAKQPEASAHILSNLGAALAANGNKEEAETAFNEAIRIDPQHWSAQLNLALLYNDIGNIIQAEALLLNIINHSPNFISAHILLGNIFLNKEDYTMAAAAFTNALRLSPSSIEATIGQIGVLRGQNKLSEALILADKLSKEKPDDPTVWHIKARLHANLTQKEYAETSYRKAIKLNGNYFRSRWGATQLLPRICSSQEEMSEVYNNWLSVIQKLETDLRLDTPEKISEAVYAIGQENNFSLHYHPGDHLEAQKSYGNILTAIATAAYPELAQRPSITHKERPRIGFVSAHIHAHSINKTHAAWIHFPESRIEKIVYYCGHEPESSEIIYIMANCDKFYHSYNQNTLIKQIAADKLDALIWLDHGMDARWQLAAALPLAPLQINGLGHPITSGLTSMTHAISAELMEGSNPQSHYNEKTILLPGTASFYSQARLIEQSKNIERERNNQEIWALCSQNLRKYLPRDDYIFAEIATNNPNIRFHFIAAQIPAVVNIFKSRLKFAFTKYHLNFEDFCIFHPQLSQLEYLKLNQECDIFLDNPAWNGNNTSHEAAFFGLPIISQAGELMRERHGVPIINALQVPELLTQTATDYINIATKLASDPNYRREVQDKIKEARVRLFDDPTPINSLRNKIIKELDSLKK